MDRKELIHTWSIAVADGRDKSVSKLTAEQPRAIILDPTIAEKQLEFEHFKFEQEIKMHQQQLDAEAARENARLQLLKEQEQAKIDAESARDTEMKKLEAHKLQLEADNEIDKEMSVRVTGNKMCWSHHWIRTSSY